MRTIELKRKSKKKRQEEREPFLRSYNTVDYNTPEGTLSKQFKAIRSRDKQRNKSLTLKEVTPLFNDHLTSENARIQGNTLSTIRDDRKKSRLMLEYLGKQIKLPLI